MGSKKHQGRFALAYEGYLLGRFLRLPGMVVLAALWLLGAALISLFGLAFYVLIYVLIYLLGIVSGA